MTNWGARRIRSLCSPLNILVSFAPKFLYFCGSHVSCIGKDALKKLLQVRDWIKNFTPPGTSPSKSQSSLLSQQHVGTLVSNISSIGVFPLWILSIVHLHNSECSICLNLRSDNILYSPIFFSYLYIGLDCAILFIEQEKIELPVCEYLQNLRVEVRDYNGIWSSCAPANGVMAKSVLPHLSLAIDIDCFLGINR